MAGRKPMSAAEHVGHLEGSSRAKERLTTILLTLQGGLQIERACARVGVKESCFHELRKDFLQEAVGLLEPRAPGRPRHPANVEELAEANRRLTAEVTRLREELANCQARREVAAILAGTPVVPEKKGRRPRSSGPRSPSR